MGPVGISAAVFLAHVSIDVRSSARFIGSYSQRNGMLRIDVQVTTKNQIVIKKKKRESTREARRRSQIASSQQKAGGPLDRVHSLSMLLRLKQRFGKKAMESKVRRRVEISHTPGDLLREHSGKDHAVNKTSPQQKVDGPIAPVPSDNLKRRLGHIAAKAKKTRAGADPSQDNRALQADFVGSGGGKQVLESAMIQRKASLDGRSSLTSASTHSLSGSSFQMRKRCSLLDAMDYDLEDDSIQIQKQLEMWSKKYSSDVAENPPVEPGGSEGEIPNTNNEGDTESQDDEGTDEPTSTSESSMLKDGKVAYADISDVIWQRKKVTGQ
ncbi:hypothetical protein CYMTET_34047 [Cymbomonas tetramitiformis]|uniref:Uncharacterized protein n=1 Tax=Cymbomonas tetramitiformis TaxID=36881 RepID=A0AAE0FBU5_9CHLO|nr:hypothetical protein CYMTET_34047 [Cymbomonas tetramitiformis]